MAVYNAVAWWHRRERHLGMNAVIYSVGFAFEAYQTSRHFRHAPEAKRACVEVFKPAPRAEVDPCECGDGFCWCGDAESKVVKFAATGS